jgi:hypothetical protein
VNKALNDYLSRIFHSCPFTEELCTTKQCIDCSVSKNLVNKQKSKQKLLNTNVLSRGL